MNTMTSVIHGIKNGIALTDLVLHTVRDIGHPCDSKEITTRILGVSKGARGWYETNASIRTVLYRLERYGCVKSEGKASRGSPKKYTYIRDNITRKGTNPPRKSKYVATGIHRVHHLVVEVNDKGIISRVLSNDVRVCKRIYQPRNGAVVEYIDPVGISYCYLRSQIYSRKEGWWTEKCRICT